MEAKPLPLSDLRLLEGSLFKHPMGKDVQWLLDFELDHLLYCFRLNAGLQSKGENYGGNVVSFGAHSRTLSFGVPIVILKGCSVSVWQDLFCS